MPAEGGWDWFAQAFAAEDAAEDARGRLAACPGLRCFVMLPDDHPEYVVVAVGPTSALDAAYCVVEWERSSHVVLDADTIRDLRAEPIAA